MPSSTLRVWASALAEAAERPGRHPHAERGDEGEPDLPRAGSRAPWRWTWSLENGDSSREPTVPRCHGPRGDALLAAPRPSATRTTRSVADGVPTGTA